MVFGLCDLQMVFSEVLRAKCMRKKKLKVESWWDKTSHFNTVHENRFTFTAENLNIKNFQAEDIFLVR